MDFLYCSVLYCMYMERDDDVGAFCFAVLSLRDDDGIVEMDGGEEEFSGCARGAFLVCSFGAVLPLPRSCLPSLMARCAE